MQTPVLVQAGQANSIDGREGDMSGINVDSDGSFWIANEYATPALWGTVIAHFTLPLPQATNGTFGESDQVGTLGTPTTQATQFFNGNLQPQQIDPNLVFPGGLLDPGNRNSPLPEENHSVSTTPGGATIVTYSFPDVYGNDPTTGQPLHNQITANEEQTVRELFKLYSYYTGLTFIEKPGNSGDDWIVVGDPRVLNPAVIANTVDGISTGSLHDYYFGGRIVGLSVINGNIDWGSALLGQSTASGNYFSGVAMHGIGLNLGLEYNNDGPPGTIMGDGVNIDWGVQRPRPRRDVPRAKRYHECSVWLRDQQQPDRSVSIQRRRQRHAQRRDLGSAAGGRGGQLRRQHAEHAADAV